MFSDFLTHRRHQNSAGTASQHRFHRANRRCIRYMSPPTPPPAPCKAYSMFLCVIFTTSRLARAYAPGGSSCMILLDFRPTKQGFERCDMQRHTSSTEPIGLILAHTPPRMSRGREERRSWSRPRLKQRGVLETIVKNEKMSQPPERSQRERR